MVQLDKNQSYFFLFETREHTLEQVRSYTLEECYENCFNDEYFDDLSEVEDSFNSYFTGESAEDGPWYGDGIFLHARIAPGERYRVFELKGEYEEDINDEDYEVCLNDGRKCTLCNDTSTEFGGLEFEDGVSIFFSNIPTELLDELKQKTSLVIEVSIEQFEEDWYKQEFGRFVAIRKI